MSAKSLDVMSSEAVQKIELVSRLVKTKKDYKIHINHFRKILLLLKKAIKTKDCSLGNFSKIETNILTLQYYLNKFKLDSKKVKYLQGRQLVWQDVDSCFKGRIKTGSIINLKFKDPKIFLDKCFKVFVGRIKKEIVKSLLKVNVGLVCKYIKPHDNLDRSIKHFQTQNVTIDRTTNLSEWYKVNVVDKILNKMEEFQERDSGWALLETLYLKVNINSFNPISVGFSTYVNLPTLLKNKKAVINIRNNDAYCFLWAIVAALHPAPKHKNPLRVNSYPHFSTVLNYEGIKFPIDLKSISKFEYMNKLSINVYTMEKSEILPLTLTKTNFSTKINLLMIPGNDQNITTDDTRSNQIYYHFALIKNLSRLIGKQCGNINNKKWYCNRCLNHFMSETNLLNHQTDCNDLNDVKVCLPQKGRNILKFKNYKHKLDVPFVIYADLESILVDYIDKLDNNNKSTKYQKHEPFSIAYYLKCSYDESLSEFSLYTGKDCMQWFAKQLKQIADKCDTIFSNPLPMKLMTEEERINYFNSSNCYICEKPFLLSNKKCLDYDHLTGKYRGASHNSCNLNFTDCHVIPVAFHNLSGYDSHFIIRSLCSEFEGNISLLPINKDKYISFTKYVSNTKISFRFIDSYRFMPSGLEKLASYLESDQKIIIKKYFNDDDDSKFKLVTRKGIFPYEYLNSWNKLHDTQLPSRQNFFSKIKNCEVSESEYQYARRVWKEFDIKTLGEYAELYLKIDVLLLADVFENFRVTCKKTYDVDPLHYYTAPGLAFDSMLKMTKIEMELFTEQDVDMALFIEKGIRGGVSQCCNRYAKANNKYMGNLYNPNEETSYLMYYDVVNLYGAAMCSALPYGGFQWIPTTDVYNEDFMNISDNNEFGYILEVDIEYPKELFEKHKDLPLCPEHLVPPISTSNIPKLLTTLYDKKRYVIHYRNLQQAVKLGLKITNIHRILKFKQSKWLEKFIDLNTELRKNCKNEFEKEFYKLMNNACFGKTIENVRKYRDVKLVTKWGGRYGANYYISQPNFHSCEIFDENMILIELKKLKIIMNKPIFVGMSILDISKTFLYNFHYNYVKEKFGSLSKLYYTDTDSLIYQFHVDDIFKHIKEDIHMFDTSDYAANNPYGIPQKNKKVLGLMKDENKGVIMLEFIGLRSKMYCYKLNVDEDTAIKKIQEQESENFSEQYLNDFKLNLGIYKKAKGVQSSALKCITFENYYDSLFNHTQYVVEQNTIQSKKHNVFTIKQIKSALNPHDDKRIICYLNKTDTVPWGYYDK